MIRNLKVLGLALASMFAMSVVMASAASAADFGSAHTTGTTFVTAFEEEEHKFTVNNRTVTCHDTSFTGESVENLGAGTWNGVTIKPKYENCTAFGLPATVDMNSCDYKFTALTAATGEVHVGCTTAGDNIRVTVFNSANHAVAPVCTFHIGPQKLGGLSYTNSAGEVKVGINVANISTNVTGPILTCGTNGIRPATYTGSANVKGYTSSTHGTQTNVEVKG